MKEQIQKIEKSDIKVPRLNEGDSAIVFQRHERYERDRSSDMAGSLNQEHANATYQRNLEFFNDLFGQDSPDAETMVLFTSSDTRYADKGYRSMETAQLAQDAAIEVLNSMDIDPRSRIINLSPDFAVDTFDSTGQSVRPDKKIREPQIFDSPEYVDYLRDKYGRENGAGNGISSRAWAMHEMDAEREVRESHDAEGIHDLMERTRKSLIVLERYARVFHANNPHKKLLIWTVSHYDTISPLVKNATGQGLDTYVPVDYGAGVVIDLHKDSEPTLTAQGQKVTLHLGKNALTQR